MHTRLVVELSARTSRLSWNLEILSYGIRTRDSVASSYCATDVSYQVFRGKQLVVLPLCHGCFVSSLDTKHPWQSGRNTSCLPQNPGFESPRTKSPDFIRGLSEETRVREPLLKVYDEILTFRRGSLTRASSERPPWHPLHTVSRDKRYLTEIGNSGLYHESWDTPHKSWVSNFLHTQDFRSLFGERDIYSNTKQYSNTPCWSLKLP